MRNGNINKQFDFLGLDNNLIYNHLDKRKNVADMVTYMFNRSNIMFKYHNLPDSIPETELEKLLQTNGYAIVGKINGDLYAINGGLGGETDVYNRPTIATVSVPYFNFNDTWEIDKDCVVIKNDSYAIGLIPMFVKYCTLMNENEITMMLATVNKRIQDLLSANDDNTIESAKQFLKDVFEGKLGVIAESKLFDSLKVNNSSTNAQVNLKDLFEFEQYLKASMFNEIGLSANFNMKRERLTSAEIETNSDNLYPLVDDMLNNRRLAIEKINEMFETDIEVEFNSSWDYRVFEGASIHSTETEVEETQLEEPVNDVDNNVDSVDNLEDNPETDVETGDNESEVETDETEDNGEIDNDETQSETDETGNEETDDNPETSDDDEEETM
ncbi:MAG: hypothetical protein VZR33_07175 [Methanosphaera sp.]|nr:hypothetical protein [Methanosphaera sp.]